MPEAAHLPRPAHEHGLAVEPGASARDHLPTHTGVAKLHALTGLRFVAAAMIVVHHSRGAFGFAARGKQNWPLEAGVSFFFVLSGFILMHVYPALDRPGAVRRFFAARIARVWPAHFLTFLIALGLGYGWPPSGGAGLASTTAVAVFNAAMWHAIVPLKAYFFSFNSVSWSISTEFFFYAAFPFLVRRFVQTWRWKLAGAYLVVSAVIAFCTWRQIPAFSAANLFEVNRAGMLYVSPVSRVAEFVLGMTAALFWKQKFAARSLSPGVATGVEISCVALCLLCLQALSHEARVMEIFGSYLAVYLRHAGTAPVFAALIVIFACGRGWLSRLVATPAFVLLGEISFSVYLLHQILLGLFAEGRIAARTGIDGWPLFAIFWLVLLATAWAMWRWIERPARSLLLSVAAPRGGRLQ